MRIKTAILIVTCVMALGLVGLFQPWRELNSYPCWDASGHENYYNDEIAELRIYKIIDPYYGFYMFDQLEKQPLFYSTRDNKIMSRILKSAEWGDEGVSGSEYCGGISSKYILHIVTVTEDGSMFGNFQVTPGWATADAPADFDGCASVTIYFQCNLAGWVSGEFSPEMKALGIMK